MIKCINNVHTHTFSSMILKIIRRNGKERKKDFFFNSFRVLINWMNGRRRKKNDYSCSHTVYHFHSKFKIESWSAFLIHIRVCPHIHNTHFRSKVFIHSKSLFCNSFHGDPLCWTIQSLCIVLTSSSFCCILLKIFKYARIFHEV